MSVNKVNKTTGDLSLLAGGTLFADNPIGSIIPYGGATAPAGWFICDGTELVRATYPELFAVIGTSFGTPSDNTKFKLPDLREATTKGIGLTGKSNNHIDADGLALGEFIDDRVQDHDHYQRLQFSTSESGQIGATYVEGNVSNNKMYGEGIHSGRYGDTTEVKAVGVNYIIKAVSIGVPADFMSAVDNAVEEVISDIGTTDITESSALANIGTAANATQHDINLAIDSLHQYDDNSYVEITGLTPSQGTINISAKRKGDVVTLRVRFETASLTGNYSHLETVILAADSLPAKYRPSLYANTTCLGWRDPPTSFMIGRFIIREDGSVTLGEYYTVGNEATTTVFPFTITYVV